MGIVRRLSSSGDFGLVLVHAAAHIQVDPSDVSNDLDPRFTQHFHRSLKVLTQGRRRSVFDDIFASLHPSGVPITPK